MKRLIRMVLPLLIVVLMLSLVGCQQPDASGSWYGKGSYSADAIDQMTLYEDGSAAQLIKSPYGETIETSWSSWKQEGEEVIFESGYVYQLGKDDKGNEVLMCDDNGVTLCIGRRGLRKQEGESNRRKWVDEIQAVHSQLSPRPWGVERPLDDRGAARASARGLCKAPRGRDDQRGVRGMVLRLLGQ